MMNRSYSSQTECPTEKQRPGAGQLTARSEVLCVCGGFGFPRGAGSTARIVMVGKALQMAGTGFRVLHCGPSPLAVNTQRSGVFEGIPFEYTTTVRRPKNAVARSLVYLWALLGLTIRLVRLRPAYHHTAVWLYILDGPTNLYVAWLCRLLGLALVQELCEWWPGEPSCSAFTKWLYRKRLFRNATGVVVISKLIEERARKAAAATNPSLRVYRLPSIVDPQKFNAVSKLTDRSAQMAPTFLWCGTEDWQMDVLFLIRATAQVQRQGHRSKLIIVGSCSERYRTMILNYAEQEGLSQGEVVLTGYVDDRKLETLYRSATALLLPLRDDDRSRTRMPNKIGEYLASGAPVITCRVGDLTDFLKSGVNAYLAEPGDERDFAEQMLMVLRDPATAERIGSAGQQACATHLDYRVHASGLARFFGECIACCVQGFGSQIVMAIERLGGTTEII